jgi:2-oxoisovalerate dehydrogenase E1 component alpha subunit
MMTLRTFDARMQMAQRQGKTSFYMQHTGRGGRELRLPQGAFEGRHELPDLSPGGLLIADDYPMVDDDEPDLLQRSATR